MKFYKHIDSRKYTKNTKKACFYQIKRLFLSFFVSCYNGVYKIFEDEYGFEIRREITPLGTQLWLTKIIEEEGKLYECSYIYHFDKDFTSNAKYTIEIKKVLKSEVP